MCRKGTVPRAAHARLSASEPHAVISRHYRYRFAETAKSNVFPLRKVNLKAVNAKGLSASEGKVRVIVVAFVKAVKYTVETIVDVAVKTSRARTG